MIVGLYGGLGNQMFQYAMGLSLSIEKSLPLVLDKYGFKFDKQYRRNFELRNLNIGETGSTEAPYKFRTARLFRFLSGKFALPKAKLLNLGFLVEGSKTYDGWFLREQVSDPLYVMGYWQDEEYFAKVATRIRSEFTLRGSLSPINKELGARIAESNSVMIHIRRYGTEAKQRRRAVSEETYRLPADYYERSVQMVMQRIDRPHFYVFSDDPAWAEANFKTPGPTTYMYPKRGADIEDLFLMSMCKHHVIANSSFSWWGAWLGEKDGGVIVAPRVVTAGPNIPSRWVRV